MSVETLEIIAQMRKETEGGDGILFSMDGRTVMEYAKRLESAIVRERELFDASVARVRELEGMLGGAADCLVGAAIQKKRLEQERTEAAPKCADGLRGVPDCNGCLADCVVVRSKSKIGNAAKQREVLEKIAKIAFVDCTGERRAELSPEMVAIVDAALAEPPRNCDVGTVSEQSARYINSIGMYSRCLVCLNVDCCETQRVDVMEWLQRPFGATPEKGGAA